MIASIFVTGYRAFLRAHDIDETTAQEIPAATVERWVSEQEAGFRQECPDVSFAEWLRDRFPVHQPVSKGLPMEYGF